MSAIGYNKLPKESNFKNGNPAYHLAHNMASKLGYSTKRK
jgi:hypothetical protein